MIVVVRKPEIGRGPAHGIWEAARTLAGSLEVVAAVSVAARGMIGEFPFAETFRHVTNTPQWC